MVRDAEEALEKAEAACLAALREQDSFKSAQADEAAKLATLEALRKGPVTQARLDAGTAYTRAKQVTQKIVDDALRDDPAIAEAKHRILVAKQELIDAEATVRAVADQRDRAQAELDARDPIKVAIKEKRLVVGMTIEQAQESIGSGSVVAEQQGATLYRFGSRTGRHYEAWMRGGRIIRTIRKHLL